jgi:hypothetical protein
LSLRTGGRQTSPPPPNTQSAVGVNAATSTDSAQNFLDDEGVRLRLRSLLEDEEALPVIDRLFDDHLRQWDPERGELFAPWLGNIAFYAAS